MKQFVILIALTVAALAASTSARAFGDDPNGYYAPLVDVGCWRWNWYQHAYYNVCPVYPHPKAYMYPTRPRAIVAAKG